MMNIRAHCFLSGLYWLMGAIIVLAEDPVRVYIVESYEQKNVCGANQAHGIKEVLNNHLGDQMIVKTRYMNTKSANRNKEKMRAEAVHVLEEIAAFSPDLVFTIDDNAFREVGLVLIKKPFPVIFSGMNMQPEVYNETVSFMNENRQPTANITGVYEKLHVLVALRCMSFVVEDLRYVVILLDNSTTGKAIALQLQKELEHNDTGIETDIRVVLSEKEYYEQIEAVNKDERVGAVYNVVLGIPNEQGEYLTQKTTMKAFIQRSTKPSMSLNFAFTQLGLLGGASVDFVAMGRQAGELGIRALNGVPPDELTIEDAEAVRISFNLARAIMLQIIIPDDFLVAADFFDSMELLEPEPQK